MEQLNFSTPACTLPFLSLEIAGTSSLTICCEVAGDPLNLQQDEPGYCGLREGRRER